MWSAGTSCRGSLLILTACLAALWPARGLATSQWSRKTATDCTRCHTVFPRLNAFGERYLRNGYHTDRASLTAAADETGGLSLGKIDHLLGFRINVTPAMLETNSLQVDSTAEKSNRWTIGNPNWIQAFVAGNVQRNISFFSELEYTASAFKFNWFYFNLTPSTGAGWLNAQVGNISPLEFASYPNRLPQLPALKGEVFLVKTSNGAGEASVDMSSARPGIQYFGHNDWVLGYAGVSSGPKATQVNQFVNGWGGVVLQLPESFGGPLEGSTATLHYYVGTDTKSTGATSGRQLTNRFTRLSPQIDIRAWEQLDVQAAWVFAMDENRDFLATRGTSFDYNGLALEAGYMPRPTWHLGLHYDWFESDNTVTSGPRAGKPVLEFNRIVPAVTYVLNENIRGTLYWEHDLTDKLSGDKVDRIQFNVRSMF